MGNSFVYTLIQLPQRCLMLIKNASGLFGFNLHKSVPQTMLHAKLPFIDLLVYIRICTIIIRL